MNIPSDWLPTAANINALPEPLRRYIHDLETRTDPAGDVRRIAELKDQVEALQIRLQEARTTQRDEFAKAALMAMADSVRPNAATGHDNVARAAYAYADAMLEARKEREG